ncbi:KICSTOR complex protein ITFG2 [Fragariocoptes setiger]|uniref:KICSTOR complex protein ITFG2 n=1 Tax=Fragariocoptes setiger TaxID=1670756 RepID=A0ABQ7S7H6_9ACAR|nr:KICSTOR complex protein ITFG2 [Fragariocoptes setiger]
MANPVSANFYPCGDWVPQGVAKENPERIRMEPEQLRQLIAEAKNKANQLSAGNIENQVLKDGSTDVDDDDAIIAEYGLDDFDDSANDTQPMNVDSHPSFENPDADDDGETNEIRAQDLASELAGLTYYPSNHDDPYLRPYDSSAPPEDDSENEAEELKIQPGDNLIVVGHVSRGSPELEVYLYNQVDEELYLHHDVLLGEYPCCVRWLSRARGKDGNYAIVGNMSSDIEIWNLDVVDILEPLAQLKGHKGAVIDICCNNKAKHLVASGGADLTIRVWNVDTLSCETRFKALGEVASLQFDPNSANGPLLAGDLSKNVALYDFNTNVPIRQWNLKGEVEKVYWPQHCAKYASKSMFYASDDKGYVYKFDSEQADVKTGQMFKLKAHDGAVSGLLTSPRWPNMLVTSSADESIKVWDLDELDKHQRPVLVHTIDHLKLSSSWSESIDISLVLLVVDDALLIDKFRNTFEECSPSTSIKFKFHTNRLCGSDLIKVGSIWISVSTFAPLLLVSASLQDESSSALDLDLSLSAKTRVLIGTECRYDLRDSGWLSRRPIAVVYSDKQFSYLLIRVFDAIIDYIKVIFSSINFKNFERSSVTKNALVIGDADNDRKNELVCANLQGELAIFKGHKSSCIARANDLGMVTACIIGDIKNIGKNQVIAINTEGWLYVFDAPHSGRNGPSQSAEGSIQINQDHELDTCPEPTILVSNYEQRMPANAKVILLADLDGDGLVEVIIGLTDRVLRTYRWVRVSETKGKLVGIYKWEFADQIGAVSLNPSQHENCLDIIVAQPGGTYARLECVEKRPTMSADGAGDAKNTNEEPAARLDQSKNRQSDNEHTKKALTRVRDRSSSDDDNVQTEYIWKLTPEYHQLSLAQMRNPHISTDIIGGINLCKDSKRNPSESSKSSSLIVISTLDGTLMLVDKDEILWSMQVDHQLFASSKLDLTMSRKESNNQDRSDLDKNEESSQYLIACAWDGKTYIIDERRNYLRFKFPEAVSSFTSGNYYFNGRNHPSIVYATFQNRIILYYDIELKSVRPRYVLNEIMIQPHLSDIYATLLKMSSASEAATQHSVSALRRTIQRILYEEIEQFE